jgi:uncharacterized protein
MPKLSKKFAFQKRNFHAVKRIALISDTHSYLDEKIVGYLNEADEIWHAGDLGSLEVSDRLIRLKPLRAVWGNIDGAELRQIHPENNIFECEGIKVLITHIAGYPGKYSARVRQLILEHKPGIVICGHSHVLKVIYDKELQHLHLNPGAAGVQGFHSIRTMIRFTLDKGKPSSMEVIELGKRI